ncbi:MAG: response regulator transcription factor [Chitinophagales bacterium]
MPIRVLIADDHQMMLDGLRALLERAPHIAVVAQARNGKQALEQLHQHPIDVLLTDISMPEMDGVALAHAVQQQFPAVKVIALSMFGDSAHIQKMLDAGVKGYIYKNASNTELLQALEQVMAGGVFYSQEVAAEMMRTLHHNQQQAVEQQRVSLTSREIEILKLLSQERSNAQIGQTLFISERTVETHRKNIYRKTGTASVVGLIKWAYENGII